MSWKPEKSDSQQQSEHFITARELATRWRVHPKTIRKRFRDKPGVIRLANDGPNGGKRGYVSLRIPERLVLAIEQSGAEIDRERFQS